MKKILKISSLAFLLLTGVACENDDQTIARAVGGPELITPASGTEYELSPANEDNEATTLVWNHADYDVQTEVNYEIQVALAGTNFAEVVSGGTTTNRFFTWSVAALNQVAIDAGLTPYTAGDLDVRVRGTLGANAEMESFSNVITITVTAYTTELPKLAVPGNHQGWDPPTAPRIASSGFGETDYEGYVWLDGGFKFVGPNAAGAFAWGNTDWGDDGSFSGVLAESGESDITAAAGYYRVNANTTTLLYTIVPTNWGIVGAATPGGWDNSTALTYNPSTKKWEGTVVMTAGGFKFRANNSWDINLGGDSDVDGSMNYGGPDLSVDTAGTYNVVLDLSNPRQYTYSVTLQ